MSNKIYGDKSECWFVYDPDDRIEFCEIDVFLKRKGRVKRCLKKDEKICVAIGLGNAMSIVDGINKMNEKVD